jgi:hypothetical protein
MFRVSPAHISRRIQTVVTTTGTSHDFGECNDKTRLKSVHGRAATSCWTCQICWNDGQNFIHALRKVRLSQQRVSLDVQKLNGTAHNYMYIHLHLNLSTNMEKSGRNSLKSMYDCHCTDFRFSHAYSKSLQTTPTPDVRKIWHIGGYC